MAQYDQKQQYGLIDCKTIVAITFQQKKNIVSNSKSTLVPNFWFYDEQLFCHFPMRLLKSVQAEIH